jgi:hypothetical protein
MKGRLVEGLKGLLAVIAFVENQRDMFTALGELAVMGGQILGNGAKLDRIGDIARIDLMKQRDMEVGRDQQAEADLAQVPPFLFVVTALGQLGRIAGIQVTEEVGPVMDESAQVQLETLLQPAG